MDLAQRSADNQDWDRFLDLLRRWKDYIDLPMLSYCRSMAWREIGESEVALEFAECARLLEPDNQEFQNQWLDLIAHIKPDVAVQAAEQVALSYQSCSFKVCYTSLLILVDKAKCLNETDYWKNLIPFVEFVSRSSLSFETLEVPFLVPITFDCLGNCYFQAGYTHKALEVYEFGIRRYPSYSGFWAGRGVLSYQINPRKAISDLEQATKYHPLDPAPLMLQAHYHLMEKHYSEAIEFIDRRLALNTKNDLKAILLDWKAMALSEIGADASQVFALFDEAIRLNPHSETAIRNRDIYLGNRSAMAESGKTEWQIESPNLAAEYSSLELPKHKLSKPKLDLTAAA